MRGVILFVHPLGTGEAAKIYGHGCHVLIEAAEHQGKYAALNIPLPNTAQDMTPPAQKRAKTITQQETPQFTFTNNA
ncbi:unnamed protein product [Anisakis simplex]|uniref:Thioesterase domain-containing protein n=1 Tax=Anisakis simplex TaxID=6269 RepID=A0A0M3JBY6_ANISI|nr:unnamed protein product [Anisakis simplex]